MQNYIKAEEDKKNVMAACKQADAKATSAEKKVARFKEQKESVMVARREANAAKRVADDLRQELARSEGR